MIGKVRLIGASALATLLLAVGCQSYDFEPVEPLAVAQASRVAKAAGRQNTPNLMLVVDKSGSMNATTDPGNPSCAANCGNGASLCGPGCPTRWTDLQAAMDQFLTQSGTIARMGLMTFPANAECQAPAVPRIDLPTTDDGPTLQATADDINATLSGIQMTITASQVGTDNYTGGGTPTGNSLAALATYGQLADPERPNFVLLLTDGLPNCNDANEVDFNTNPTACACQAQSCSGSLSRKGCLDAKGTVQRISELKELGIQTIVVGFGIDTASTEARSTLQSMAQAGGFPRLCPNGTNAECGTGNACNTTTKECNNKYFSAKNAAELATALTQIGVLVGADFCDYNLDIVPESAEFISVLINDQVTPRGGNTWEYEEGKVRMKGALCEQLKNAQVNNPVNVEIRVIQSL